MKQINISFVVTEADKEKLKEIAAEMGFKSVSSMVREAVLSYLRENNFDFKWEIQTGKHEYRNYL